MNDREQHHPTLRSLLVTGILQIIGGAVLAFSAIVLVIVLYGVPERNHLDYPVSGLWSGAWTIIVGFVGVLASSRPGVMRGAYMVLSLMTIPPVTVAVALGAAAAANNVHYYLLHPGYKDYDVSVDDGYDRYNQQLGISLTKMIFHLLVCLVGCSEITIALLASAFCCNGLCPGNTIKETSNNNTSYQPPDDHSYVYPPPTINMEQLPEPPTDEAVDKV
ncbi:uncharacterized protein [Apostichopus japonicus]|uniref:uncharacterized protein n=1 Tax=Stichopus japonicus TaxID=307972 RepID=UPI003AB10970